VRDKWVPQITHHCPSTPFILCGLRMDLRDDIETLKQLKLKNEELITFAQGIALAREIGAASFVECSAALNVVDHVFTEALSVLFRTFKKNSNTKCVLQ